jgi:hypothetical protein
MSDNQTALSFAAIVFLAGAALTILFYRLGIKDSATIIALLIVPLLIYGIVSGKILELSAPGGWSAKFQEVAKQRVDTNAIPITQEMKELQPVEKESLAKLEQIIPKLQKGRPVALILFFGRQNYHQLEIVRVYFERLRQVDREMVVIVVDDKTRRFVCMIEGDTFFDLINTEQQKIIDAINNGQINYLRQINAQRQGAAIVFRALQKNKTNADAIREMKNLNTKTMVVLSDNNEPIAMIRRDDILAYLFDELID